MRITPKDWSEFQHYKDRDPTWIKLHKTLLDNFEFHQLPLASKALAPMLWLLASEYPDGIITATKQKLSFRLRMSDGELMDALLPLVDAGFFSVEHVSSELLAKPERAASHRREETQVEKQVEEEEESRSAFADALTAYNSIASELGWPQAESLNRQRRAKLAKRLEQCGGVGEWRAAMSRARASPWLRGELPRGRGYETWTPDLDFFLQEKSFTKLIEGKYDHRNPTPGSRSKNDNFLAGVLAAVQEANTEGAGEERADSDPTGAPCHALPPPGLRAGTG